MQVILKMIVVLKKIINALNASIVTSVKIAGNYKWLIAKDKKIVRIYQEHNLLNMLKR